VRIKFIIGICAFLLVYSLYCLFRIPTIADSLVIIANIGLLGYLFFLQSREVAPKKTSKQMEDTLFRLDELKLQKEIAVLQSDISRAAHSLKVAEGEKTQFQWNMRSGN
jgi:hypothetical protein